MPTFKYRTKGTNDEKWNEGEINAADIGQAEDKLDKLYGVQRDDNGEQTNGDMIKVEIIK